MADSSINQDGHVNPDPLGRLTDRLIEDVAALLPPDKRHLAEQLSRTVAEWAIELIGRASSQSASAVLAVAEPHQKELKAQRKRQDRARVDIADLQQRVDDHSQRLTALELGGRDAGN